MYWAFVSVTAAKDAVFSAGMHCLGFRDAELLNPPDLKARGMMLHEFLARPSQFPVKVFFSPPVFRDGVRPARVVRCKRV
jgi:hypothetical protein